MKGCILMELFLNALCITIGICLGIIITIIVAANLIIYLCRFLKSRKAKKFVNKTKEGIYNGSGCKRK